MKYLKPALTFSEQVDLLKSRGLTIEDSERAIRHLSNISYYRLSAYMLPFKKLDENGNTIDEFREGTSWDNICDLYKFDRKLRLLVFDAIERVEVALRTQLIYQLSHKYGSHWLNDVGVLKDPLFQEIQTHIAAQCVFEKRKNVEFINHYFAKYSSPPTPPSWMSVELLYFGQLSKICKHLQHRQDKISIAKTFGLPNETILCSWLHSISYVRNLCAHHSRLWNIQMAVQPAKFNYHGHSAVWLARPEIETVQSSKLYYFLCIILYLLQTINPRTKFRQHFLDLLKQYPDIDVSLMGFPSEWNTHPLWTSTFA